MVRVRYSFGSRHTGNIKNIKKQKKTYPDIMEEVVQISDIVLEVLDARFIEETRNLAIEKDIKKLGKKIKKAVPFGPAFSALKASKICFKALSSSVEPSP